MSEGLGKFLKAVAITALVVAAIAFTGGLASVPLLGGWQIGVGLLAKTALVSYAIGSALDPAQIATGDFKSNNSYNLTLTSDSTPVRWQILGRATTAGTLVFRDAVGDDNEVLLLVIKLAGHECQSLERFYWDGEEVVLDGSGNATGKYAGNLSVVFHNGAEDQLADSPLVAQTVNWTDAHRLQGVCYVVVTITEDPELFQSGLEEMRFDVKGASAYDPRKDSTKGGAGSHRVTDQSTWEFTDNPALLLGRYFFGYRQNGKLIYGRGISENRIVWEDVAQAADDCEEQIGLLAGGTENRYTLNGVQFPDKSHQRNMSELASSMAGIVHHSNGWRMQAGVPRLAVATRSTDDFIGPIKSQAQRDPKRKFNAIKGLFQNADNRGETADYPNLRDAVAIASDGDQEHWLNLNLPFTNSQTMAQRISKIALYRTRMNRDAVLPLNAIGLQDSAGDTVFVDHPALNLDNLKMRLEKWEFRIVNVDRGYGFMIIEHLTEEDDALIYSWDPAIDERPAPDSGVLERWDKQPFIASFVESSRGTRLDTVSDRVDDSIETGGILRSDITVNQGDGTPRIGARGVSYDSADDGDAVSFTEDWSSGDIPEVKYISGGITTSSSLTAPYGQKIQALNLTVSGFTMSARLTELASGLTPVTDTGAVEDTTDIQWSMDKSVVAEAEDDVYDFQFDVEVTNIDAGEGLFTAGLTTVGIYVDDGSGFVQFATLNVIGAPGANATTTRLNETKAVIVDGVGQIAGKEFRVIRETSDGKITNFDSVSYSTGASASDETATPTGAEPIEFQVLGGADIV